MDSFIAGVVNIMEGRFTMSIKGTGTFSATVQRRFSTTGSFEVIKTFTAAGGEVGTESAPAQYKIVLQYGIGNSHFSSPGSRISI